MGALRLSGGVQDPQLGQAVGQSLVFKRPQDGVIRPGGQVDEIAFDVGAHKTLVGNRPRRPEALLAEHGAVDVPQGDRVRWAVEADAAVAAKARADEPGIGQRTQQFADQARVRPQRVGQLSGAQLRDTLRVGQRKVEHQLERCRKPDIDHSAASAQECLRMGYNMKQSLLHIKREYVSMTITIKENGDSDV